MYILMDVKWPREAVTKAVNSRNKWIWHKISKIRTPNRSLDHSERQTAHMVIEWRKKKGILTDGLDEK